MGKVYIFGHKKPDSDSVCSAIALSYLKNKLGMDTVPKVLGNINSETEFILDYFKIPYPSYLNDVKLQIKDIDYSKNLVIDKSQSVYGCYLYMKLHEVSRLPIVDSDDFFIGSISMKEIASSLITGDLDTLYTSYANIKSTLNAKEITNFHDEIIGKVIIPSYQEEYFINNVPINDDSIVIVGNRYNIIKHCILSKAKLIVLTSDCGISDDLLQLAHTYKVSILSTGYNTITTAKKITRSNYISQINFDKEIIHTYEDSFLSDFVELANKTKFSNYPVLNSSNKCLGIVSLSDISNQNRKKVILVDHNELEQSVEGLEEADIIEIVDHHKLGSLGTSSPINFRNMPVGSTCTIVYMLFKENNVKLPNDIAGIILAAILSDTLLFKSPTTTKLDIDTATSISKVLNIDYEKFAMQMFKARSSLKGQSPEELLYSDFKDFSLNNKKIGIGQITTVDVSEFIDNSSEYISLVNNVAKHNGYDLVSLFVTDIINNGSYCFYNDSAKDLIEDSFNVSNLRQGYYFKDILSRKKQIVPNIINSLQKK